MHQKPTLKKTLAQHIRTITLWVLACNTLLSAALAPFNPPYSVLVAFVGFLVTLIAVETVLCGGVYLFAKRLMPWCWKYFAARPSAFKWAVAADAAIVLLSFLGTRADSQMRECAGLVLFIGVFCPVVYAIYVVLGDPKAKTSRS